MNSFSMSLSFFDTIGNLSMRTPTHTSHLSLDADVDAYLCVKLFFNKFKNIFYFLKTFKLNGSNHENFARFVSFNSVIQILRKTVC